MYGISFYKRYIYKNIQDDEKDKRKYSTLNKITK